MGAFATSALLDGMSDIDSVAPPCILPHGARGGIPGELFLAPLGGQVDHVARIDAVGALRR